MLVVHLLRTLLALVFLTCLSAAIAQTAASDPPSGAAAAMHYRAVFHLTEDDPGKWGQVLNNARFTQEELGADKVEIEVVMNGKGIDMLRFDSSVADRVEKAHKAGVHFKVCENTMTLRKMSKSDMLSVSEYVPSGIVRAIRRQQEGWAYVKN